MQLETVTFTVTVLVKYPFLKETVGYMKKLQSRLFEKYCFGHR